jgi:DNA-nicking Smr family endonuclease
VTGDRDIWEAYKRTVSKPVATKASLRKKKGVAKQAGEHHAARRRAAETAPPEMPRMDAAQKLASAALRALERKREKSIRQGAIEIDGRLDLHGMTQVQAFETLGRFLRREVKAGKRHLLIITGKGSIEPKGETRGVLRASLQDWLGQLPEAGHILALRQASPRHGGSGAFYVILRKKS